MFDSSPKKPKYQAHSKSEAFALFKPTQSLNLAFSVRFTWMFNETFSFTARFGCRGKVANEASAIECFNVQFVWANICWCSTPIQLKQTTMRYQQSHVNENFSYKSQVLHPFRSDISTSGRRAKQPEEPIRIFTTFSLHFLFSDCANLVRVTVVRAHFHSLLLDAIHFFWMVLSKFFARIFKK